MALADLRMRRLSFIYCAGRPTPPAFYPPSLPAWTLGGQPSADGIHELATPGWHSTTVARRLVVSCTAFSPLPPTVGAVVLFCHCSPLPTTCIFTSRMPYVARTFLSRSVASASDRPEHCFRLANLGNFFGLRIAATKNLALFFCFNARWFGGKDQVCETLSKKVGAPLPFGNCTPTVAIEE